MSTENTITTAAADVAAAPNATLDELVGTTTNTAILPEPDAHAYDEIATGDADPLILGGHKFTSRFILGSGRYDLNLIKATIENAGTQIVTMALRRCRTTENNLLDYIPKGITMLPNTSGARNAEEAVRIARLAREVCQTDFVKVEIEHEAKYLLPDNEETIKATEKLAKEGFVVMPYMFPDPIAARQLEEAGAAAVMPLGSLIGSNMGLRMRDFIEIIIANAYFFPGYRFLHALRKAARRGVRVKLIVQGEPDMPIVKVGARLLYNYLVKGGVHVYEYRRKPLHGKVALMDDHWATVGSSNLDPLSLSLNLEANLIIHDRQFNQTLRDNLLGLLDNDCVRVDDSMVPKRTWWNLGKSVLAFHFLRHFPAMVGWLPAHTPTLARVAPPVQPKMETQDRVEVEGGEKT